MIYFDNAATSFPKPVKVRTAVCQALESFGNPSRGAHELALNAARCVEYARVQASELFGCRASKRVAFTSNITEALNMAIASVNGPIVTTAAEHNSVLRPVYRAGQYTIVDVDEYGRYEPDDIKKALRPDTAAVVLSHASNLTGQIHPLQEIGRLCRERGLLFIVDAAQTAGLLDVDMSLMGIDALCFTGHKSLYGPQGTGGICLSDRFLPSPLVVGGSGSQTFNPEHPAAMPGRLEAGTLNGHGLAGLSAGLEYIKEQGPENLLAAADKTARYFHRAIKDLEGVVLYGRYGDEPRLPIVALNVGELASDEVAAVLAEEYDIAVRPGTHCAPLLHRAFGTVTRGAVRFSFSHFNTLEEADVAIQAIKDIAKMSGRRG
jgi:cysteine desulfurase family protein